MKKTTNLFAILAIVLFTISSCTSKVKMDNAWKRNFNVCKKLKDKILVYPVFIEDRKGEVWKKEEIQAFLDSINIATNWIKDEATKNDVQLDFLIEAHPSALEVGLPGKTIDGTYSMANNILGVGRINKHYDNVAKKGFKSIKNQKGASAPFITRAKAKDDFVARLRNQYQLESVVLLFVHKPDKLKNNILFTLNTLNNEDIEYSVLSFNQPSIIAEQILELFGAAIMQYDVKRKKQKEIDILIEDHFPNEIMVNPFTSLQNSEIGAVTAYLIGWKPEYDAQFKPLMQGRKVRVKK